MTDHEHQTVIEDSPYGDFAADLADLTAEYIEGQGPGTLIQRMSGGPNENVTVTEAIDDYEDFLADLRDLVARHYPDQVPEDGRFDVESFEVEADHNAENEPKVEITIWEYAEAPTS